MQKLHAFVPTVAVEKNLEIAQLAHKIGSELASFISQSAYDKEVLQKKEKISHFFHGFNLKNTPLNPVYFCHAKSHFTFLLSGITSKDFCGS